jgi:hypothetical protein
VQKSGLVLYQVFRETEAPALPLARVERTPVVWADPALDRVHEGQE